VLEVGAHREVIIKHDRSAPALFMVCQGYCEGLIQGDNGVQVASRVLGPGDWFPLPTLSLDLPSPFTVTAQKCTLLRLPAAAFRSHLLPFVQADVGLQISHMRDIFAGLSTADAARLLSISKVTSNLPGSRSFPPRFHILLDLCHGARLPTLLSPKPRGIEY
jgi:CRP-like cAMP-binding protein